EPQCVQVCPVSCIPIHPQHIENRETLWQKYQRLQQQDQASSGVVGAPAVDPAFTRT
ncbi:MAG: ferredoxin, partial [Comamonadaceae bacterium]|nr:ferredoxin [Comamonadaceae bacterium]